MTSIYNFQLIIGGLKEVRLEVLVTNFWEPDSVMSHP